jgi:uncharacterized protein (TIGR02186 family)
MARQHGTCRAERIAPLRRFFASALILGSLLAVPARADEPPAPEPATGEPLVADLASRTVALTPGGAGADLLLFGAVQRKAEGTNPGDVVVVVRGPSRSETLRRKDGRTGLWVTAGQTQVDDVPTFYRIAATRPLTDIAGPDILDRYQLGLDHLAMRVHSDDANDTPDHYRAAVIRLRQRADLYGAQVQELGLLGHQMFRADMHFPANAVIGNYVVEIYQVLNGEVIGAQSTPLIVSKQGLSAGIFDLAHRHAVLYGLAVLALAVAGGGLASIMGRKT